MRLVWTSPALTDRDDIWLHIAKDNLDAAIRMDDRFSTVASTLLDFPESGKRGIVEGTREILAHRNYRLIYMIQGETILIVALVHVARQWPLVRMDDA